MYTQVVLGYHTGELAGNLNYTTSRSDVEGIREGRIQILKDHQPFKRTYVGVNGISVTGINSHVLLHGHYKPKVGFEMLILVIISPVREVSG